VGTSNLAIIIKHISFIFLFSFPPHVTKQSPSLLYIMNSTILPTASYG
jgi:hypothetical protein